MTRTRGPELSKELRTYISTEWMFKQRNMYQISEQINNDTRLLSKFGKTSPVGIHYHIKKLEKDLEGTINEDALDTYIGEFIRARAGFEMDVAAVDSLIETAHGMDDIELELKLRRHRHDIKLDSFKMLQDSALPLQVKKLKIERDRMRPKPLKDVVKQVSNMDEGISKAMEEVANGSSKEGDTTDTKPSSE